MSQASRRKQHLRRLKRQVSLHERLRKAEQALQLVVGQRNQLLQIAQQLQAQVKALTGVDPLLEPVTEQADGPDGNPPAAPAADAPIGSPGEAV